MKKAQEALMEEKKQQEKVKEEEIQKKKKLKEMAEMIKAKNMEFVQQQKEKGIVDRFDPRKKEQEK